ncbi:hypothetical protein G6M26_35500 [Agrobacterium tumefaciens]|nr:hypothetical protein [Agrobacterium tumefaciens]NTE23861.1 hypothetical protein [Agrobacterium tumefaciens]
MATLNSFIRSANASYKRAARANERQARAHAKQHQQYLKDQIRNDSIAAVNTYNEYLEMLISIHKSCSETLNWNTFLREPEPIKPKKTKKREEVALVALHLYKPSILDKLLSKEYHKRAKLQTILDEAIRKDLQEFNQNAQQYNSDLEDWKTVRAIAKGVLADESSAYRDAISFFDPFANINQLGTQINCIFNDAGLTLNVSVNTLDIIPDYVLTATATGKLSNKKMTATKFNELYQDYVCSCAIRVARETFALLPINCLYVNAIADLLDPSTGRILPQPILSCKFIPENLSRLNFAHIDCSDAMRNFVHNMKFSKTTGFAPIHVLSNN